MPITKRPIRALIAVSGVIIAAVAFAGPANAAPYTTQPTLSVSNQTPAAGSRLKVCGKDFHARTRVAITLGERRLASARTDRSGAFCKTVKLPRRVTGARSIVATDRWGSSASVLIQIVKGHRHNEDRDSDRKGRDTDREGRDSDHEGRNTGHEAGDIVRIRALGVSASSADPAPAAGVKASAGTSGLAVAGAAVIGIGAFAGGGLILFTNRRRKAIP